MSIRKDYIILQVKCKSLHSFWDEDVTETSLRVPTGEQEDGQVVHLNTKAQEEAALLSDK